MAYHLPLLLVHSYPLLQGCPIRRADATDSCRPNLHIRRDQRTTENQKKKIRTFDQRTTENQKKKIRAFDVDTIDLSDNWNFNKSLGLSHHNPTTNKFQKIASCKLKDQNVVLSEVLEAVIKTMRMKMYRI
jgi:hypothetical protein